MHNFVPPVVSQYLLCILRVLIFLQRHYIFNILNNNSTSRVTGAQDLQPVAHIRGWEMRTNQEAMEGVTATNALPKPEVTKRSPDFTGSSSSDKVHCQGREEFPTWWDRAASAGSK